ncbi:MAG: hypothetical protein ABSD88_03475 [Candidatus Korobacteraceae bacterium]|jgi:hypothetical protein
MMTGTAIAPTKPRSSAYNFDPGLLQARAADLPGMEGLYINELFPDVPPPIRAESAEQLRNRIKNETLKQLQNVDFSKIGARDTVNILASHHGFSVYGGEAYVELIKTVKEEIERRCGTQEIRLVAGVGLRYRETEEYIQKFGLGDHFNGKAWGICPVDEGIPIETEIGTLYGLRRAYSSRWIIHTHNNDIRELHYHRQIGRLLKPFSMSYARIETRSLYHQSMGSRSANLLPRMIFNSQFVQNKFVCSVILQLAPTGIIGVSASSDLIKQDADFTRMNLSWFGKIITLLSKVKDAIVVIDYPGPLPYTTAGGILFGNFLNANVDEFDLTVPFPAFNRYTDSLYPEETPLYQGELPPLNPAIRALVINYCSKGWPGVFVAQQLPTVVVGPQAEFLSSCEQNRTFMNNALKANSLHEAMAFAKRSARTADVLVFDGAVGGFNVSKELAAKLRNWAPTVSREVDEVLMPRWLEQRGIA